MGFFDYYFTFVLITLSTVAIINWTCTFISNRRLHNRQKKKWKSNAIKNEMIWKEMNKED
jgi:uncharacterized membrane protein